LTKAVGSGKRIGGGQVLSGPKLQRYQTSFDTPAHKLGSAERCVPSIPLAQQLSSFDTTDIMATVEEMQNKINACVEEIKRLKVAAEQQSQSPPQATPIVVAATPTAKDLVDEFTKVGKLESFDGTEEKFPEWDFNLTGYVGGSAQSCSRR